MQFCPNYSKYLVKKKDGKALVTRLRCKQWSCDYCAALNRKSWRRRIKTAVDNLQDGYIWQFWTITAHESLRDDYSSLQNITASWNNIYEWLRTEYRGQNIDFKYIKVTEPHKDGAIHFHVLFGIKFDYKTIKPLHTKVTYNKDGTIRKKREKHVKYQPYFLPNERWLKRMNRANKAGYKCEISNIEDDKSHVVNYIVKYITKTERALPKGTRRIQPTHRWVSSEREISAGWQIYDRITFQDILDASRENLELYDVQLKKRITLDDIDSTGNYRRVEEIISE